MLPVTELCHVIKSCYHSVALPVTFGPGLLECRLILFCGVVVLGLKALKGVLSQLDEVGRIVLLSNQAVELSLVIISILAKRK